MRVESCSPSDVSVNVQVGTNCTFEVIDTWDPDDHAKTCDKMFFLRNGTGAYVWDCDEWVFLDFTSDNSEAIEESNNIIPIYNFMEWNSIEWGITLSKPVDINSNNIVFINNIEGIQSEIKPLSLQIDKDDQFTYINVQLAQYAQDLMGQIACSIIFDQSKFGINSLYIVNPYYDQPTIQQYFTGINRVKNNSDKIGWFFKKRKIIDLLPLGLKFYANNDIELNVVSDSLDMMYVDLSTVPIGMNYLTCVLNRTILFSQVFTKV